jgi:hypothetical protein
VVKTRDTIAVRTPMSRTLAAFAPNSSASRSGRPKSFTSVAPGAENRSVIWLVMPAFRFADSRRRPAIVPPIRRAGSRNSGTSTRASTVTCQASPIITASTSTSWITLETRLASVSVSAAWAPITSLSRRLTSAPVRVRVKNATGIRCTWENTARRRSRISPSPIRADSHRVTTPIPASSTASPAIAAASTSTVASASGSLAAATIVFTTEPASSGVATPMTAETTVNTRNTSTRRRYRLANRQIRDSVPGAIDRCPTSARRDAARIIDHSPTPSIWRTRSLVTRTARWNAASAALLPEHPH